MNGSDFISREYIESFIEIDDKPLKKHSRKDRIIDWLQKVIFGDEIRHIEIM